MGAMEEIEVMENTITSLCKEITRLQHNSNALVAFIEDSLDILVSHGIVTADEYNLMITALGEKFKETIDEGWEYE
jgi:predicted transcriptional regulator